VWIVAGLALATALVPANAGALHFVRFAPTIGYARTVSPDVTYAVNLTDAPSYAPRFLSVVAGGTVTINLDNNGSYSHSFTLSSQANTTLNTSWTPQELDANLSAHPPQVGANVTLGAGGTGSITLTYGAADAGDSFEFVSIVPYQFQAGMWGFLNVTPNSAPLVLSDNVTDTLRFSPDVLSVEPHSYPAELNVTLSNPGSVAHTFTVASQTNVTVPTAFVPYFAVHPPLANTNLTPGSVKYANFSVPAPGVYMYICEYTGHYVSGMYGFLYVGVPPPAVPAAPSTAIVDTWILAGSGVLVGVGAILVAIASLSGRFPRPPGSRGGHP